ncbi:hypothetical protein [Aeoliella sp. SH292]|uniref:hypothetical protein n=1 Tax=Aeoliella sp. SH292 TaxID=3454464 RepID=UPI003F96207F
MSVQPPARDDEYRDDERHDDLLSHWCSEVIDGEPSSDEFDALLSGIAGSKGGRRELLLHLMLDSQLRTLLGTESAIDDESSDSLSV